MNPICQMEKVRSDSSGSASTPVENDGILPYFLKISILIKIKHVNLAGLQHPVFRGIYYDMAENRRLPETAVSVIYYSYI
jgi:hypothetical protein